MELETDHHQAQLDPIDDGCERSVGVQQLKEQLDTMERLAVTAIEATDLNERSGLLSQLLQMVGDWRLTLDDVPTAKDELGDSPTEKQLSYKLQSAFDADQNSQHSSSNVVSAATYQKQQQQLLKKAKQRPVLSDDGQPSADDALSLQLDSAGSEPACGQLMTQEVAGDQQQRPKRRGQQKSLKFLPNCFSWGGWQSSSLSNDQQTQSDTERSALVPDDDDDDDQVSSATVDHHSDHEGQRSVSSTCGLLSNYVSTRTDDLLLSSKSACVDSESKELESLRNQAPGRVRQFIQLFSRG